MKKVYYLNFKIKPVEVNTGYIKYMGNLKNIKEIIVEHKGEQLKLATNDIYENKEDAEERLREYLIIKEFKNTHEHRCKYCRKFIYDKEDLTVDHIIPRYNGGETIESNLVISCSRCNKEKSNTEPMYYMKKVNRAVKSQLKKQKSTKRGCQKIGRNLNLKANNIEYLAKKDSNVWDLEAFFNRKPCKSSEIVSF